MKQLILFYIYRQETEYFSNTSHQALAWQLDYKTRYIPRFVSYEAGNLVVRRTEGSTPRSSTVYFKNLLWNLLLHYRNKKTNVVFTWPRQQSSVYFIWEMGFLLSFQVIIPKMLRQCYLVSLPCTVGLWRVHLRMHLFHFYALSLLFTKRKEWFDICESSTRKHDCMHWATEVLFTILRCYFLLDVIYLPLVRLLTSCPAGNSLGAWRHTSWINQLLDRLRISWAARLKIS